MRKWILFLLAIILPCSSLVVHADEVELTVPQLMELYKEQSTDKYKSELNFLLDESNYKNTLDNYENTENTLALQETQMYMYELEIEEFIREEDLSNKDFINTVNRLGITRNQYLSTLEKQLDTIIDMELLKHEFENINQLLDQDLISQEYDFESYLYDYALACLDNELLQYEQQLLQKNLENNYKTLENGTTTFDNVQELENQLYVLENEIANKEVTIKKYYDTIIYTLNLDPSITYDFNIDPMTIELLDIQEMNDFINLASHTNFELDIIDLELEQYEQYLENIQLIYNDEEDPIYQEKYLDYQLNTLTLEQKRQAIYLDLKTCYYNVDDSVKEVTLEAKKLTLYKQNYENILRSHEKGAASDIDLYEAEYSYKKSTLDYYQVLVNYNQVKSEYLKYLYGISN